MERSDIGTGAAITPASGWYPLRTHSDCLGALRQSPGTRALLLAAGFNSPFRHTAISMLKNAGVSDSVTRDIVGHESVAVSRAYTHIDAGSKRAAMEKLPTI